MSETLYRKYRPKNFSEVIGQTHIVRTLGNAIKNDRVGHAYLFTGSRGTGKTSIARIFAKTINCENPKDSISCESCTACKNINDNKVLDIIEIDAASNTGVDNIRELRETIALPPTMLEYKVYIIDEVHMLSTGAFNALLKTLEEPPTHVIFILATTEIHKVPQTIISRCQRFDFARLPLENIIEKLELIAQKEKIKIEKEALKMIALSAEGGMRDAESLLGQIISLEDKNITAKEVQEILGTTDQEFLDFIADKIISNDTTAAIQKLNDIVTEGYDLLIFTKSLINYFRQLMLLKVDENLKNCFTYEITSEQLGKMFEKTKKAELAKIIITINLLLEAQGKISTFLLPQLALEIAIIKATKTFPTATKNNEQRTVNNNKNTGYTAQVKPADVIRDSITPASSTPIIQSSSSEPETGETTEQDNNEVLDFDTVKGNWNRMLVEIRPVNHSLCALLSNCQVMKVEGLEITLATPYEFYAEKLVDPQNRLTIEQVFSKILESKVRIKVLTDKSLLPKQTDDSATETQQEQIGEQFSLLDSALEIMGGRVVE